MVRVSKRCEALFCVQKSCFIGTDVRQERVVSVVGAAYVWIIGP